MVKKISGRKLSTHHIEFRKLAENAEMGLVSRGQLIGLVKKLEKAHLIKDTEAKLLLALLDTASISSFEKGGVPIVFKSNYCLSKDIGRSESRVSILLSRLYDCGLVVMRDSGNFKRYSVRSRDHGIIAACGIDLRILVVRYYELKQKTDEILEAQNKQKDALHCFRGLVRQIKASYTSIEATPFTSLLFSRMQKIVHIIGRPAKASVEKLHKAIGLFQWILERVLKEKTLKTKYRHFADEIHIEHTTLKHNCNCNKHVCSDKPEHTQINNMTYGHNKTAYENIKKGKTETPLSSKKAPLLHIKPEFLNEALPNTAMFLKHGLQSERDLTDSMEFLAKMKGISTHTVEEAKKTMGLQKAALAIAIIFEKHCKNLVKSSGGYLRGMIAKENRGELYLERSLHALQNEAFDEKLNDWRMKNTEKHTQSNSNQQKNLLFKSQLNEVLKTLKMQTYSKKLVP
ncbi:plasmid replication protein RepC [Bartonella florencae]|uniref:plasmid replication protein RepC n=1 Tax=Bartonella florencae TaxID=928210 RepID=UPI0002F7A5BE|nr:plasmid replication protein RepC [Bartonella florencae]